MSHPIEPYWETAKEGAWRLGVSPHCIRYWALHKRVPRRPVNRRVVFYDLRNPPAPRPVKPKLTVEQICRVLALRDCHIPSAVICHCLGLRKEEAYWITMIGQAIFNASAPSAISAVKSSS